jgi:hypothetical protein
MKYAYVTTNLLDIWGSPKYNSERVSQAFFGEIVTLGSVRSGFCRITRILDNYRGWMDIRFLEQVPRNKATSYLKSVNAIVGNQSAVILDSVGQKTKPHFLYYGTRLAVRSQSMGWARLVLPDGTTCRIRSTALRPIGGRNRKKVKGADLVTEAKKFLGVPYLWGGISPAGFDCSGLVQTICSRFGIEMPRDTKDQIKVGLPVDRKELRTGDLCFFDRHVGFAIGRDRLIHASVGGGGVRINGLTADMPEYRPDLDRDFAQARRIA